MRVLVLALVLVGMGWGGGGQVIKGWDVGFTAMTVGESATLTLRYDYGYGEQVTRHICLQHVHMVHDFTIRLR